MSETGSKGFETGVEQAMKSLRAILYIGDGLRAEVREVIRTACENCCKRVRPVLSKEEYTDGTKVPDYIHAEFYTDGTRIDGGEKVKMDSDKALRELLVGLRNLITFLKVREKSSNLNYFSSDLTEIVDKFDTALAARPPATPPGDADICFIHDVPMDCDDKGNWHCSCCFADQESAENA